MRFSLALSAVLLAVLGNTIPAKADTIFNVFADLSVQQLDIFGRPTGTTTPDGTFTGTITINTLTGLIRRVAHI